MAAKMCKFHNIVVSSLNPVKLSRTFFTYSRELSHPINRLPQIVSPEEAVCCVDSNMTIFLQGAGSTPTVLVNAVTEHGKAKKLKNVTICNMHTRGKAPYTEPDCEGIIRSNSFFMAENVRKAVNAGRADSTPLCLQDLPTLFKRGIVKPDVAFIQVSPPDEHGFCSLGTSVDATRSACMHAKYIVAQINKQSPRTFGSSIIHSSHIDYACCVDMPLNFLPTGKMTENDKKIGKLISENLIKDGATLQTGVGALPDAVLKGLYHHKDLGIHSEMFANGVVELVEKGCITNARKPLHTGHIVGSFLIGDQKLYDFVNNNPFIELHPIDYVNSYNVIKQHPRMTAINSCIEVDLSGQVCSDSIGTRMYSGFGGQVDFIRGAAEGTDGEGVPVITLNSTTRNGQSKIVPYLKPGAGVVTARALVHYIVTEHGIAQLFGKNLRQRAYALIQIADPKHREALEKEAFKILKAMPIK